jgi:hypothetical protein
MQALSITIPKTWSMLKILKCRSNFKVRRSKIMTPIKRSYHKEYTYKIPITYHSKGMASVEVFEERPKTICPRSFNTGALMRHGM